MTKTRFRIYTEYIHTRHIAKIVDKYFSSFSMFSGIGYYNDERERCLVIEVVTGHGRNEDIASICREINTINHQKCCLVTSEPVNMFIVADKK